MVLFKRRKVEIVPTPQSLTFAPHTEVWEIAQTCELFTDYESYLARRDFYYQKDFTCEITGHSNMTFFDAWESETTSYREIDNLFPEPLRGPVLRKVQFATFGRLEHLVNWTYEAFKQDFWPREHVVAVLDSGEKAEGTVREKVSFPERMNADGTVAAASSRYMIALEGDHASKREPIDVQVDGHNIYRDRRNFSKLLLRSFLKGALTKESWHGAPWTVKAKLAHEYNIPSEIPPHLQQSARMAERKAMAMQKKNEPPDGSTFFNYLSNKQRNLEVRPFPTGKGGQKHRFIQQDISRYMRPDDPNLVQYQIAHNGQLPPHYILGETTPFLELPYPQPDAPTNLQGDQLRTPSTTPFSAKPEIPIAPPPPPQKFPCEDTEVPLRKDATPRPSLKFYSEDLPSREVQEEPLHPGLKLSSVGPLLEIWNSLNVHSEVFILDSFTLDDFAEAMRFSLVDVECELLSEVHCAVLKQLVDDQGQLQVTLPEFESDDSEEEDEEEGEDEEPESVEPSPEPVFRRTTRSSLKKEEAEALKHKSPTPEEIEVHRAAELFVSKPWKERLKERVFRDGGWQVILVGLLHQVSLIPRKKASCDRILALLVPMDEEPTEESVRIHYFQALNCNLRIEALEMITMLSIGTAAIRKHLEDMSSEMTELRKKKIEQQRLKKDFIDELHTLDEQRKALAEEVHAKKPDSQVNGQADIEIPDVPVEAATNGHAVSREGSEDEAPPIQLRRGGDRKRKREEEVARREKAKKEKAALPKLWKEEIKLNKILEEIDNKKADIIDCEEKIGEFTNDLRETDCQRTKCLGRDRFCNRYIWFERNGMPFGGVPHTSTAHYNYANGRIWVQGPDEYDREGLIDADEEWQAKYVEAFDMTVPERKEKEEGDTHLDDATQWGYIDNAEQVDQLMGWLDERGLREKALKKELLSWREIIVDCMKKMREHLDEVAAKKLTSQESEAPTRFSTRRKDQDGIEKGEWQCLQWRNTLAVEQLGAIHSEGARKKRKGVAQKQDKAVKNAKLVTRTGASYGRR